MLAGTAGDAQVRNSHVCASSSSDVWCLRPQSEQTTIFQAWSSQYHQRDDHEGMFTAIAPLVLQRVSHQSLEETQVRTLYRARERLHRVQNYSHSLSFRSSTPRGRVYWTMKCEPAPATRRPARPSYQDIFTGPRTARRISLLSFCKSGSWRKSTVANYPSSGAEKPRAHSPLRRIEQGLVEGWPQQSWVRMRQ